MTFLNGQALIRRAGSYTHDVIGQGDVTGLVAALAAKATPGDVTTAVSAEASARTSAITAAIAALINSAPGALDTLKELADAINDDASFAATVTTALALKAPLASPALTGIPTAPTVAGSADSTTKIATTAFVQAVVAAIVAGVSSFNSRTGAVVPASGDYATADITGLVAALALKAALASPALTGTPTAPTPSAADNSTKLSTTAYVDTADALKAPLASPTLTGTPAAPTVAGTTDSTTKIATTAFVQGVAALLATLASPAFTGNPTAPTATVGDNDTSIATTAFVQAAIAAISAGVTSFNARSGAVVPASGDYATADITGLAAALALLAPLASPTLTGTPAAPTAAVGTNTTQLASTAFALANRPGTVSVQGMTTAWYYTGPHAAVATTTWANGDLRLHALPIAKSSTIDQVAFEVVTTAGGAGSVHRVLIYADNGGGYPGALILDAGTVATATTGTKTITVSQILTPGLYWIGVVQQAAPTPAATLRYGVWNPVHLPMIGAAAVATLSSAMGTWKLTGVTGAGPNPLTAGATPDTTAPRVLVRGA